MSKRILVGEIIDYKDKDLFHFCLKNELNASRPSEHPSIRGKNVKIFRWDHRLQRRNPFMAFKWVPRDGSSNIGSTL